MFYFSLFYLFQWSHVDRTHYLIVRHFSVRPYLFVFDLRLNKAEADANKTNEYQKVGKHFFLFVNLTKSRIRKSILGIHSVVTLLLADFVRADWSSLQVKATTVITKTMRSQIHKQEFMHFRNLIFIVLLIGFEHKLCWPVYEENWK